MPNRRPPGKWKASIEGYEPDGSTERYANSVLIEVQTPLTQLALIVTKTGTVRIVRHQGPRGSRLAETPETARRSVGGPWVVGDEQER